MSDLPPTDPSQQQSSTPPPITPPPADSSSPVVDYSAALAALETNPAARTWGMAAHLAALIQLVGVPTVVGPLVVWLVKKNEFPFVDDQGKEAVNFHITALIVAVCIAPTVCLGIGIILYPILGIAVLVMSVIGAMKANEGIRYRYPLTLRLIR